MTGVEITLILVGIIFVLVSFFVQEKLTPKDVQEITRLSEKELKIIVERELKNANDKVEDAIDAVVEQSQENAKRLMEKETNEKIQALGFKPLTDAMTAKEFMRRPEIDYATATQFVGPAAEDLDAKIIELLETEIKYEGYINKALDQVAKMKRMEEKRIPKNIDWDAIDSIATEARQKFKKINPETIGQASRISGVNPADISILMVYLEGNNKARRKVD